MAVVKYMPSAQTLDEPISQSPASPQDELPIQGGRRGGTGASALYGPGGDGKAFSWESLASPASAAAAADHNSSSLGVDVDSGLHPVHMYQHELRPEKHVGGTGSIGQSPNSQGSQSQFAALGGSPSALSYPPSAGPAMSLAGTFGSPAAGGGGGKSGLTVMARPPSSTAAPGWVEKRIFGMRRSTFFLALLNVILVIALILVGVLTSQLSKGSGSGSSATGAASCDGSNTSPSTSSSPGGSTQNTNSSNADTRVCFLTSGKQQTGSRPPLGTPTAECPRANNQTLTYTVPSTNLTFLRTCGADLVGSELGRFPVLTMGDCLALCAQLNLYPSSALGPCTGVSWLFGGGPQGEGSSYCYPKMGVSGPTYRGDTESAVLVTP